MRCPACGISLTDEAVFCHRCGSRVAVERRGPQEATTHGSRRDTVSQRGVSRRQLRYGRPSKGPSFVNNPDYLDEEVLIWVGRYSWKGMIHEFLLATLTTVGLILAGLFLFRGDAVWLYVAVFLGATWALLFCVLAYRKLNFLYKITDQRLIHETGILYQVLDRTEMIDVDDVRVEQDIIERIVNVGKIRLRTSDRTHPYISFRGISQVRVIADLIDDARRRERMRRGIHVESV